jgi:alkylhydroperoxidase family enzyme
LLPLIGNDRAFLERFKKGWRDVIFDAKTKAILEFTEKLTREPASVSKSDNDGLKAQSLTDEQILDVVLIIGEMNLSNRISMGLGVEPPVDR